MVIDNAYECLIFSHCGGCKGTAKSPQCPCVHLSFPGLSCMYIYKETMDILIQMFMENLEGNKKLCVVLCH